MDSYNFWLYRSNYYNFEKVAELLPNFQFPISNRERLQFINLINQSTNPPNKPNE